MKVGHLNFSDINGGAARAAYRLHRSLKAVDVESKMHVVQAVSGDAAVESQGGDLFKLGTLARPLAASWVRKAAMASERNSMSTALLPSRWPRVLNASDLDIVHMHWICAEMMSVEDVARINKPIVWTFHDMWPFSGAEHYPEDDRWRQGYSKSVRRGVDLNRWVWRRKARSWIKPFQIVAPSQWLAECARNSALMSGWPVACIPNPIDTDFWKPIDRSVARSVASLPQERILLAFGAIGGGEQQRKGFDLLLESLRKLHGTLPGLELLVFGQRAPKNPIDLSFPIHYAGHLSDDISLKVLYCAADAVVIPSRMDNLPNIGVEAMACGIPVIAFDTCGLRDLVLHQSTGWLAKAFDTTDLAQGIRWVMGDDARRKILGHASRQFATERFSSTVVAAQYKRIYERLLEQ